MGAKVSRFEEVLGLYAGKYVFQTVKTPFHPDHIVQNRHKPAYFSSSNVCPPGCSKFPNVQCIPDVTPEMLTVEPVKVTWETSSGAVDASLASLLSSSWSLLTDIPIRVCSLRFVSLSTVLSFLALLLLLLTSDVPC